jgi:hypothetical protein
MIPHQVLVEVPRGEARIARPIQMIDFLAPIDRNPLARSLAERPPATMPQGRLHQTYWFRLRRLRACQAISESCGWVSRRRFSAWKRCHNLCA